ncbi:MULTISPECIES: hypothetical protein [unclassified Duganella]|uniref:hypothetical protein n=1 Tax=unclassified Duganella TaxID=2636909 RepID=UPI0012E3C112|nr:MULTISPECIES: hypothetical protein [unclassified Duganella]
MPDDLMIGDRRSLEGLTEMVDGALELADECGWRYALAYLISERVPSQVIQRLLSGRARARKAAINNNMSFPDKSYCWQGRNTEETQRLFATLRLRSPIKFQPCDLPPMASRSRGPVSDDE